MHCNTFFSNSISIQKILWIYSGEQWPPTTCCPSLDASRSPPPAAGSALPATSHEIWRVMCHRNTVGAAEAGSRCLTHLSFRDCKLSAQPVSPWLLHRVPWGSIQGSRIMGDPRLSPEGWTMYAQSSGFLFCFVFLLLIQKIDTNFSCPEGSTNRCVTSAEKENIKQKRC